MIGFVFETQKSFRNGHGRQRLTAKILKIGLPEILHEGVVISSESHMSLVSAQLHLMIAVDDKGAAFLTEELFYRVVLKMAEAVFINRAGFGSICGFLLKARAERVAVNEIVVIVFCQADFRYLGGAATDANSNGFDVGLAGKPLGQIEASFRLGLKGLRKEEGGD